MTEPPSKGRLVLAFICLVLLLLVPLGCKRQKPLDVSSLQEAHERAPSASPSQSESTALPVVGKDDYPVPATPTCTLTAILPSPTVSLAPTVTPMLTQPPAETNTPMATATPTLGLQGEIEYIVKPGDTLLSIAATHQTTVKAITDRNALANANTIYVGQTLIIPVGSSIGATPTLPSGTVQHVVKVGETLSSIARLYRTTVSAILAENPGMTATQNLQVGTTVQVTWGTEPLVFIHRVRPGESLASIARLYGKTMTELIQANGIANPNHIFVGQQLVIPGF